MRRVAILLIRAYRLAVSPFLPPACRFLPTCSEYAIEAYERHGALLGSLLTLFRILRCHPLSKGGIDPVPDDPLAPLRRLFRREPRPSAP